MKHSNRAVNKNHFSIHKESLISQGKQIKARIVSANSLQLLCRNAKFYFSLMIEML